MPTVVGQQPGGTVAAARTAGLSTIRVLTLLRLILAMVSAPWRCTIISYRNSLLNAGPVAAVS